MNNKFESWKELAEYILNKGSLVIRNGINLSDFSKFDPPKPKEVVLYRHTFKSKEDGTYSQTSWSNSEIDNVNFEILKTETKTVTLE